MSDKEQSKVETADPVTVFQAREISERLECALSRGPLLKDLVGKILDSDEAMRSLISKMVQIIKSESEDGQMIWTMDLPIDLRLPSSPAEFYQQFRCFWLRRTLDYSALNYLPPPPTSSGRLVFFKQPPGVSNPDAVIGEYSRRGLKPANPYTMAVLEPFSDGALTIWLSHGVYYSLFIRKISGQREVSLGVVSLPFGCPGHGWLAGEVV